LSTQPPLNTGYWKPIVHFQVSQIANLEFAGELLVGDCKSLARNEKYSNKQSDKKPEVTTEGSQNIEATGECASYKILWPGLLHYSLCCFVCTAFPNCEVRGRWHFLQPVYVTSGSLVCQYFLVCSNTKVKPDLPACSLKCPWPASLCLHTLFGKVTPLIFQIVNGTGQD